jgi:phenylalanyl-tRNA synthetase alpha chain
MTNQVLDASAYRRSLALRDLTDAALGGHAMQLLLQQGIDALSNDWRCPAIIYRAPPVVSVTENYDDLCYPPDGASRDARYTRYISKDLLLRTQTSAMVPRALRMIVSAQYEDVLVVCPGLTYRRDAIDRLHVGEPHQVDLWRIRRGRLAREDLVKMIETVAAAMLPGVPLRLDPAWHPYTLEGIEVHGHVGAAWVEVLECGLALPGILESAGLDVADYSGLAMGIGLDRMLMLRKGIDDIRALRSNDPRIARQMLDLERYRAVSAQPPIERDLSIAVDASMTAEELGDCVRSALAERSNCLEEITVLSETGYDALPSPARERLGMSLGQKNVLLRLVIRDLDRTLTSIEGNRLRDEVYEAVHEGRVKSWAARSGENPDLP